MRKRKSNVELEKRLDKANLELVKDDLILQLREKRQELGLSQLSMAISLELDRKTIHRTENTCDCNLDTFLRIATFLGYEVILKESN